MSNQKFLRSYCEETVYKKFLMWEIPKCARWFTFQDVPGLAYLETFEEHLSKFKKSACLAAQFISVLDLTTKSFNEDLPNGLYIPQYEKFRKYSWKKTGNFSYLEISSNLTNKRQPPCSFQEA